MFLLQCGRFADTQTHENTLVHTYTHLHTNKHSLTWIPSRDSSCVKYTVFCLGRAERVKGTVDTAQLPPPHDGMDPC